jgi:hypothetical protein
MLRRFGSRLTYANVMATLAMFVALGGVSYAAITLPANSVGTKQLKNKAVTTKKLKNKAVTGKKIASNAVTSGKVRNYSLRQIDFKLGELPAGAQGPAGPKGDKGDKGDPGATGAAGIPATIKRTVLVQAVFASDAAPSGTFTQLASVGTFTKQAAANVIKVTWTGHARALNATSGFCDFQIRIDGAAPDDNAGRAVTGGTNTFGTPVGVTALFSGLAAGSHTVTVFDRGSVAAGGSCDINPGQFPETFLIEEQS